MCIQTFILYNIILQFFSIANNRLPIIPDSFSKLNTDSHLQNTIGPNG